MSACIFSLSLVLFSSRAYSVQCPQEYKETDLVLSPLPAPTPLPPHNLTISSGLLQAIQSSAGSAPGYLFSLVPLTSHVCPAQQDYTTSVSHQALLSQILSPSSRKYYFLSLHSKSTFSQNYFLARKYSQAT